MSDYDMPRLSTHRTACLTKTRRPAQPGRAAHLNHKGALEMNRTCAPEERRLHNKNCDPLDTSRED